jgi:uncharacterized repeat protein (TIGR01451 family)
MDAFVTKISPAAAVGADLSVLISASPDPGATGGQLTYHIRVSNHGPQDATGVQLSNTPARGRELYLFGLQPRHLYRSDSHYL